MKTKALLSWNSDVLTSVGSNPHPKVREVLVPLGSHSVMASVTITSIFPRTPSLFCSNATDVCFANHPCGSSKEAVWPWLMGTHCHHVITFHIRLIVIFTFVIELAEEVESHHSIEVNNNSQEAHSQNQLGMRKQGYRGEIFQPWKTQGTPTSKRDSDALWVVIENRLTRLNRKEEIIGGMFRLNCDLPVIDVWTPDH